jgi:hypothetical protein
MQIEPEAVAYVRSDPTQVWVDARSGEDFGRVERSPRGA